MSFQGSHTVKSFDDDLRSLRSMIGEMGGLARAQIDGGVAALLTLDGDAADAVVAADRRIDELELDAESFAISIIARRSPLAQDLREVIAALKIGGVIERIGDYGKNIAKRVESIAASNYRAVNSSVEQMGRLVSAQVDDALRAFVERDPYLARAVADEDQIIDDYYDSLFQDLVGRIVADPQATAPIAHLFFVIKNLERVGDHATNIAEMVHYGATGEYMGERIKGGDATGLRQPKA